MSKSWFHSWSACPPVLVLAAILLSMPASSAEELNEYRVEILVLRHLNNEARSFEAPVPVQAEAFADTTTSDAATSRRRVRYRSVPWAEFQLKGANTRLRRSRDFRPLIQLGWTQEALDPERSGWVPVRGEGRDGTRISGHAKLTVSRYLHLELELEADIPEKGIFQLGQSRRMKSGDLHYFDHPEFGVLVIVIPEPAPAEDPEPEQQTD